MESALALWISGCREKNITLDTNIICSKAKKLYETFADSEEQDDAEPRPLMSAFHAEPSSFNDSKGWFEKFKKHFGLKSVSLHGEAASADTTGAEATTNLKRSSRKGDMSLNKFLIWMRHAYFGNECPLAHL